MYEESKYRTLVRTWTFWKHSSVKYGMTLHFVQIEFPDQIRLFVVKSKLLFISEIIDEGKESNRKFAKNAYERRFKRRRLKKTLLKILKGTEFSVLQYIRLKPCTYCLWNKVNKLIVKYLYCKLYNSTFTLYLFYLDFSISKKMGADK